MIGRLVHQLLLLLGQEDLAAAPSALGDGYDIQVVPEGRPLTFGPPTDQVAVVDDAAFAFTVGPDGTRYLVGVRARKSGGRVGEPAVALLRVVVAGGTLVARPGRPTITEAVPLADGDLRLEWDYNPLDATAEAASFAVYSDDGSGGAINYTRTLAVAEATDRSVTIEKAILDAAYIPWEIDRAYRLVVRALTASGVSDGNGHAVRVVPRSAPPTGLAAGAVLLTQV